MALQAFAGMTVPLVAGVAGFVKDEIMRPSLLRKVANSSVTQTAISDVLCLQGVVLLENVVRIMENPSKS